MLIQHEFRWIHDRKRSAAGHEMLMIRCPEAICEASLAKPVSPTTCPQPQAALAAEGALLAGPDGVTEAAAPALSAIDTHGAGAICTARVLVGLLTGEAPTDLLDSEIPVAWLAEMDHRRFSADRHGADHRELHPRPDP